MPDPYMEFHQAQDAAVDDTNTNNSFSPTSTERDYENEAFLRGAHGDSIQDMTLPAEPVLLTTCCGSLINAGAAWKGSNPDKPLPPKP
jgi:hypothetical protein